MKRKKMTIIMILLIVLIPIKAYGLTGSVSIACDKTELNKDEEINCIFKGNSDELVNAIAAKISADSQLELSNIKFAENQGYLGEADFNVLTLTEVGSEKKDTFDIASFKVKAKEIGSYKIYVKDIEFTDEDYKQHSLSNYEIALTVSESKGESGSGGGQTVTGVPDTKKNIESYIYIGLAMVLLVTIGLVMYFFRYKTNKKEA